MVQTTVGVIRDIFHFPMVGRGIVAVWLRNFHYFAQSFAKSLLWMTVEPVFYLLAFGYGVGQLIGPIDKLPYVEFFAPALLAKSGMMIAFFETTYSSYTRMTRQNTFNTILISTVSAQELILGEILWATFKGTFSVVTVGGIAYSLGLIHSPYLVGALGILILMCWVFSAMGILVTSYVKSYDGFIYANSGLIVPMSLFCGTFFPLSLLPQAIQNGLMALPLTHGVMSARILLSGNLEPVVFINIGILVFMAIVLTNWSVARMVRRLSS